MEVKPRIVNGRVVCPGPRRLVVSLTYGPDGKGQTLHFYTLECGHVVRRQNQAGRKHCYCEHCKP